MIEITFYEVAVICEIAIWFDKQKTKYFYNDEIEDNLNNVDYLLKLYRHILSMTKDNYKFSLLESVLRWLEDEEKMKEIIDDFLSI